MTEHHQRREGDLSALRKWWHIIISFAVFASGYGAFAYAVKEHIRWDTEVTAKITSSQNDLKQTAIIHTQELSVLKENISEMKGDIKELLRSSRHGR